MKYCPSMLASVVLLVSRPALAYCDDGCGSQLPIALAPLGETIAADGVLAFVVPDGRASRAFEFFTVTVRDSEGAIVDGSLELDADFSVIVWRPGTPWTPGATYNLLSHVDGSAWAELEYGVGPGSCVELNFEATLTIAEASLPAPAMPPVITQTEHVVTPDLALDALVCCDGVYPTIASGPGSCTRPYLQQHDGCASLRDQGSLTVTHALELGALAPEVAANYTSRVVDTADVVHRRAPVLLAPQCLRFEVRDLARGQVFTDERCFGEDLADQLGAIIVDPAAELGELCEGAPYVCDIEYDAWDSTRCRRWPEVADAGCGCASADGSSLLWLGGLWLLRRRRR